MEATPNRRDDNANVEDLVISEVFYWPLCHGQSKVNLNLYPESLGFVLGWKLVQNKLSLSHVTNDAHNSTRRNAVAVVRETYIVAGIVPSTYGDPRFEAIRQLQAEGNQIQLLLREMMQLIQHPQSAMKDNCDFVDCRESFSIIAFWDPSEKIQSMISISSPTESKQILPRIGFGKHNGVPIILRDNVTHRIQKQIVFFPSIAFQPQPPHSNENDFVWRYDVILWNHGKSSGHMDHLPNRNPTLIRLTHAHLFFLLFQHRLEEKAKNKSLSSLKGVASIASQPVQPSNVAQTARHSSFLEVQQYALAFCIDQSLFLRHLATHGVSLYNLVRRNKSNRCSAVSRPLSSSQYEQVETALILSQEFVFLLLDSLLGAVCCIAMAYSFYHFSLTTSASSFSIIRTFKMGLQEHYRLLNRYVEYLELFPLGFKLNQSLLYNVGREVQRSWNIHERMVLFVINAMSNSFSTSPMLQRILSVILSLLPLLLGGLGCIALSFDVIRFSTIHVSILAWFTIRIYWFELYLLATLWNLFCGRKRNILRHRIDTIEYDAMHLLFGTILFAMVLFLFTTVLVGHIFYTLLYLMTIGCALPFACLYTLLRHFPWAILWFRWRRPGWFTCKVYVTDGLDRGESQCAIPLDVTHLKYWSVGFFEIIWQSVIIRLQTMIMWFFGLMVRSFIGSASFWSQFLDTIIALSSAKPH